MVGLNSFSDDDGEQSRGNLEKTPHTHRRKTKIMKAAELKRIQSSYIEPKTNLYKEATKILSKKKSFVGVPVNNRVVK